MVVASINPTRNEKMLPIDLPVIDLSKERSEVSKLIVKACEEYGFFKVINHGVSEDVIAKMEEESLNFFAKPDNEKLQAGPANPFGYGLKNIGFNGDTGEVEYILLHTNPFSIAQKSLTISDDPSKFRNVVSDYVGAVKELACEILELMAEGLCVEDTSIFSRLLRDIDSDSLFRLNHYPPVINNNKDDHINNNTKVGFGEHSDPQILTILRSNDVGGLQISPDRDVWIPVSADPTAYCVNVGDLLQALTNGRFASVRHRALVYSSKSRMSMAYFGAPSLNAKITALPEMVTTNRPSLYRPFTWGEFKKVTYSLRVADTRLNFFTKSMDDEIA